MKDDSKILVCVCGSIEHQARFFMFEDELTVEIHLTHRGFWRRLWKAVQYVVGYRSMYGDWDEMIFTKEEFSKLKEIINED